MTAETEIAPAPEAELGKARLRKEDERLITGQTNWTDNIKLPGMLHIAFVRSPFAHARITSVNVSAALAEPGVIAAYSGADFAAEQGSLPCAWPVTPDIAIAAGMLEVSAADLEWTPGRWAVRGDPDKGVTIAEIALATFAAHALPEGVEPSIDADATYDPDNFSFPHGTHLCATEVDTETGFVKIRSYVAVDDIGKVVNPLIVEGQVHGGLAQGIAQALYEEAVYDDEGNLITTTLADYLIPSATDLPSYITGRTESPAANRLGVKGVGEAGTIASTPAVVNAIVDALRPLGVADIAMPCTPERVWRAIQAARGGDQASAAEQHAARQSDQTQGNSPQGVTPERGDAEQSGGAA